MSVAFKSKTELGVLFQHLGVSMDAFTKKGYTLEGGISQIRINNGDTCVATIKLGMLLSKVLELSPGTVAYHRVATLVFLAGETIKAGATSPNTFNFDMPWLEACVSAGLEPVKETVAEPVKEKPVTPPSPKDAMNSHPVLLRDATCLYQRVKGTSHDALYYVVAISDSGLKVAMKKKVQHASIRVEWGSSIDTATKNVLHSFGIDVKGDYASGHFGVANTTHKRLLGALLFSLPHKWKTPIPDTDILKESP